MWIHGWTGDHGVTGKFSYLTASIVNSDLRLPIISIPSPMGNDMPFEISAILDLLLSMSGHIDLLLFDRGFYSKDLIMSLNERIHCIPLQEILHLEDGRIKTKARNNAISR